jgi:lipopolysaccharide/colanic/teichoic acid biosynthesis glycosyltransferase
MLLNDIFGSLGNGPLTAFVSTNPNPGFELGTGFVPSRPATRPLPSSAPAMLHTEVAAASIHVLPGGNQEIVYQVVKRGLDIVGSIVLLAAFSPILLVTYLALYISTKGRPIFVQQRVGQCGQLFRMFKFRTMCLDAHVRQQAVVNEMDGPVFKNRLDPRVTRLGRILRQFSIDELPQLVNVLLGDMSLVGPRPPILSEVTKYEPWQRTRLSVKPGLTCLWQVSGRNEIGFEDWMRMDLWYVQNQNLLTDLKLLVLTPWVVISRKGAY